MTDTIQGDTRRGTRKPRKPRGRGLRTTTGCLVCKRRHVKCDEARPQCGPCAKGHRACIYDANGDLKVPNFQPRRVTDPLSSQYVERPTKPQLPTHDPLWVLVDACHQEHTARHHGPSRRELPVPSPSMPIALSISPKPSFHHNTRDSPVSPRQYAPSPGTDSSNVSARVAPMNWFELLANDVANADRSFLLSPPQRTQSTMATEDFAGAQNPGFLSHSRRERESIQAASFQPNLKFDRKLSPKTEDPSATLPDGPSSWNTTAPIPMSAQERRMFHHFVRNLSPIIDFFDIMKHFSIVVPHLALRNVGLMKALLALSARHLSLHDDFARMAPESDTGSMSFLPVDRNTAVQYYYETLHYLNQAMQYQSYALSQEFIATATLISTYEMVDGSNHDWERHIKGVFWIQRYQNNDGESGGLRQAVWWAWLRQDIWVAMRERRRVFTFWQPKKHISTLTAPEMADRVTYLLSQCVNYASREESETVDPHCRLERGNRLLYLLQEWHDYLPPEYNPLPSIQESDIFPPIWVYPPPFAGALQMHSFARILVVLHRPSVDGVQDYQAAQKLLTASVNTICGIARTIDEVDIAASLTALPCLVGAGMVVRSPSERLALLDIIDKFQERLRWPANSLRKELEMEYRKTDITEFPR